MFGKCISKTFFQVHDLCSLIITKNDTDNVQKINTTNKKELKLIFLPIQYRFQPSNHHGN